MAIRDDVDGHNRASKNSRLALGLFTMAMAVAYIGRLVVFVYRHSYFREEDFDAMWLARSLPFGDFLFESIDEHFVPLHRLVAYGANALAPMNFAFALAVLTAFYLLAAVYMYRVLRQCERLAEHGVSADVRDDARGPSSTLGFLENPTSWLLFGAWCTYVYLGPLFVWWTAGLHRFPLIAFAVMAVHYYLDYRNSRRRRSAAISFGCVVAAFGFFPKAVLIPVYLTTIEVCLWSSTTTQEKRRNALVLTPLLALSVSYVVLWRILKPPVMTAIATDVDYHLRYLQLSWFMLRDSLMGSIWQDRQGLVASWIAGASCLMVVGYTLVRAPRCFVIWGGLAILLVLNVLATSLSKLRADLFGLALPVFLHRYYFELATIVVVFSAIALQRARCASPAIQQARRGSYAGKIPPWASSAAAAVVLAAIIGNSSSSATHLIEQGYLNHWLTRDFVRRTEADAQRIIRAEGAPLRIVDEELPPYAGTKGPHSTVYLLEAIGVAVVPATPGAVAYRIAPSGHILPTTRFGLAQ